MRITKDDLSGAPNHARIRIRNRSNVLATRKLLEPSSNHLLCFPPVFRIEPILWFSDPLKKSLVHLHRNTSGPHSPHDGLGGMQQPNAPRRSQERTTQGCRVSDGKDFLGLNACPCKIQVLRPRDEGVSRQVVKWHAHPVSRRRIAVHVTARLWLF